MKPANSILGLLVSCLLVVACEQAPEETKVIAIANDVTKSDVLAVLPAGDLTGERLFFLCQGCHSLQAGAPNKVGPNLYGLRGRQAGVQADFVYSEALKTAGETWLVWEKGTLMGFIVNSEAMVPNTWMLFHSVLTVPEIQRLTDYILEQRVTETAE